MSKEKQQPEDYNPLEDGVLAPDDGQPLDFAKLLEHGVEGNFERELERELSESLAEQEYDELLEQIGADDGLLISENDDGV